MSWKGRIIGAILGFLLVPIRPVGAVLGFCLGYFLFDRTHNEQQLRNRQAQAAFTGAQGSTREHELIIASTFQLMGYVSRGAGRINESHIRQAEYLMDQMNLDTARRGIAIDAFNFGKSEEFNLSQTANLLRQIIGSNTTMLSYLLEIQVGIAIADEILDKGEHERLLEIASSLGVSINDMEHLIRMRIAEQQFANFSEQFAKRRQRQYEQQGHQGTYNDYGGHSYENYEKYGYDEDEKRFDDSQDTDGGTYNEEGKTSEAPRGELAHAYEILGVSADTSWDDIRRAHKKMMLKYHPDRLASQGLPPEMIKLYTQKAQDIQAAFALIKKTRGK